MKISVCMAAYNGQKYIEKQIGSIVNQIEKNDEIIIVNDCSTDNTAKIIYKCNDSRIKVISNEQNLGVVNSFHKAMKYAEGNLIFLSDQDDIWMPYKVQKIKQIFLGNPDVTLVVSDAQIIDESDRIINESFFKLRGEFNSGILSNLVKNKYHGCTMAFKKEMLQLYLPFPKNIPMHDMWIGMINSIYGKTFYMDEPLIQYRIHSENTGRGITNHTSIIQMITWRIIMLKNIVEKILQTKSTYIENK